jgi:membrane-anchored protein YejM (alkaline phosphatase superfamily)
MQTSVPELADLASEPASVLERYGVTPGERSFAGNCLLARRMVERGVRFVQLYHKGWDTHGSNASDDLMNCLPKMCRQTDQATAALLEDLGQRGLLDETLVVWGGEFGRTPMFEARNQTWLGRDHHPRAFTMWFAGGGIRRGVTLGATDELGYHVTEKPVHVHDLHATMLHLLGIDHERLTYFHQGRDYRLTDVHGVVVHDLLA